MEYIVCEIPPLSGGQTLRIETQPKQNPIVLLSTLVLSLSKLEIPPMSG